MRDKQNEPSRSVTLESFTELLAEIARVIADANRAITDHNNTVDNLAKERKTLKDHVWKFLIGTPLKDAIAKYDGKKEQMGKAIANIRKQLQKKDSAKQIKEGEIRDLERDTTSIQPTVDAINSLLRSFGFVGFSLAQADNKRYYKLVRSDGTDAKETLSEGEKSFVTFLYFRLFSRIRG